MKKILVCGAGGFIGSHLVKELVKRGNYVIGVDLHDTEFEPTFANEFHKIDLRDDTIDLRILCDINNFDEVYQMAADMGGAGFIFTKVNDADIMYNNTMINLNVLEACSKQPKKPKIFYASSACVYPEYRQEENIVPALKEEDAYPAQPDSEYGWEKLYAERLYLTFARCHNMQVRIGRYHNVFGEESTYNNGREKFPAAICRKVAEAKDGGEIEVWGDGQQTRSFLYIAEAVEGTLRLMESDHTDPINIGSDYMISMNDLAQRVITISGKNLTIKNNVSNTAIGVRGRNSDNTNVQKYLNWRPVMTLDQGMKKLYNWINKKVNEASNSMSI